MFWTRRWRRTDSDDSLSGVCDRPDRTWRADGHSAADDASNCYSDADNASDRNTGAVANSVPNRHTDANRDS